MIQTWSFDSTRAARSSTTVPEVGVRRPPAEGVASEAGSHLRGANLRLDGCLRLSAAVRGHWNTHDGQTSD